MKRKQSDKCPVFYEDDIGITGTVWKRDNKG